MRDLAAAAGLLSEAALKLALAETAEIDERPDATDEIESMEFFLFTLNSDGRRGGNAGGLSSTSCCDCLLGGSEGGPGFRPFCFARAGAGWVFCDLGLYSL